MYIVKTSFKDIKNLKHRYNIGDVFESDDKKRIKSLLDRGLIEDVQPSSVDSSMTKKEIIKKLEKKGIEFDAKAKKDILLELLQGGD